jgi:predicted HTH transcriptional regulator
MSALARRTDPDTSHQAIADLKASGKHAIQMQAVLTTLRRMTSENNLAVTSAELAHHMEVDRHLAGRRLPDLANRGLAKKIGKATCSVNGTRAVTWSAT